MVSRMKKYMCVLLAIMLFAGSFGVDAKASEATTYATGKFSVTVQAGKEERARTSFPLEAGEIVTINATYSPFDADVDFGLIDEEGTFYHLPGKNGSFSKSIEISVRGNYTFAVRNNSDIAVDATGYVNY
jgi:hypothetical protein